VFCDEYGAGVYYVLDCSGAGARREITRKVPPQVRFFIKFRTTTKHCFFVLKMFYEEKLIFFQKSKKKFTDFRIIKL